MKKKFVFPVTLLCSILLLATQKKHSFCYSNLNTTCFHQKIAPEKNQQNTHSALLLSDFQHSEMANASVLWPLADSEEPEISGPVTATMKCSSAMAQRQGTVANAYVLINGIPTQNLVFCPIASGANYWTASSDIQQDQFIQFEMGSDTKPLKIQGIELSIAGVGTKAMHAAVYYSKDPEFRIKTLLQKNTPLPNKELTKWVLPLASSVKIQKSTEKFYLRIYPFLKTTSTNKYLAIRDVKIFGTSKGKADIPTVTTDSIRRISTNTATSGGRIFNNGGTPIQHNGILWGTMPHPTLENASGSTTETESSFSSIITGLRQETKYYVRAYATNAIGTAYGNQNAFRTLKQISPPTVVTAGYSHLTDQSFIIQAKVTDWGGAESTEKGIVWSPTEPLPTVENSQQKTNSSPTEKFTTFIHNLNDRTSYYVRAYAKNKSGISYGSSIRITTKTKAPDVLKTVSQDGLGDYTTVQEAFDAVPPYYTGRWMIHLKSGTYTERPILRQDKTNVFLIGDSPETTIITSHTAAGMLDAGGMAYGTSNSQTMALFADDFTASKITIANTFINSDENIKRYSATQAVAVKTQGDRQAFYNCKIIGYQDTYYANSLGRAYFQNCTIEGNVDFIFGKQTVVFDRCTIIVNRQNGVIVAPATEPTTKYGFVFLDCKITVPKNKIDFNGNRINTVYFGRPWQGRPKAAFIRCTVPEELHPTGWTTMNEGLNPYFSEYQSKGEGTSPENLHSRGNRGVVLTHRQALEYTIPVVFAKDSEPSFLFDWLPKMEQDLPSMDIEKNLNPVLKLKSTNSKDLKDSHSIVQNRNGIFSLFSLQKEIP